MASVEFFVFVRFVGVFCRVEVCRKCTGIDGVVEKCQEIRGISTLNISRGCMSRVVVVLWFNWCVRYAR